MNKHRVKGTMDEAVGSAKRKTGKLTGNTSLQVKGVAQQVKGKLENALGKIEEAVDGAKRRSSPPRGTRP
jgi:uncharacterized protein YjbJ (UPF0337 family)